MPPARYPARGAGPVPCVGNQTLTMSGACSPGAATGGQGESTCSASGFATFRSRRSLAGPAAIAAEAVPPQGPPLLVAADADHDGKVTAAELRSEREQQVARFDADRDGGLSAEEYEAWFLDAAQPRLARQFRADDRDHDGRITLEELVERSAATAAPPRPRRRRRADRPRSCGRDAAPTQAERRAGSRRCQRPVGRAAGSS